MATFTPIPGTAQPAPPGPNVGDYLAMFGTGLLGGQQEKKALDQKQQANLLLALAQTKQAQPATGVSGEKIIGNTGWAYNPAMDYTQALKKQEYLENEALTAQGFDATDKWLFPEYSKYRTNIDVLNSMNEMQGNPTVPAPGYREWKASNLQKNKTPLTSVEANFPSTKGVKEGSILKDANGNAVAILRSGKWVTQ